MEGKGRKLGWIAIGLGVLALLVALHGRGSGFGGYSYGPQGGYGPPQWAAPRGDQQAPQWVPPQGDQRPGWVPGPGGARGFQQGGPGPRDFAGPRHFGPGGFFFLPFMLFGMLIRFVGFLLLILLVARWFFRGRGHHGPQGGPPDQGRPGPEQPPYTGGTQQL